METSKNIFHRAAVWGIPFGLYLAAVAATSIYADKLPVLSLVCLVMLVGIPVLVYRYQRRQFIDDDGFSEYAALWMLGIMLFVLGAVLASLIVYLLLQYARPGFLYDQAQTLINTYRAMPGMADNDVLQTLQQMVDKGMLPTPIEAVVNAYWFITFCGSMLSAVTAWLARLPIRRKNKT